MLFIHAISGTYTPQGSGYITSPYRKLIPRTQLQDENVDEKSFYELRDSTDSFLRRTLGHPEQPNPGLSSAAYECRSSRQGDDQAHTCDSSVCQLERTGSSGSIGTLACAQRERAIELTPAMLDELNLDCIQRLDEGAGSTCVISYGSCHDVGGTEDVQAKGTCSICSNQAPSLGKWQASDPSRRLVCSPPTNHGDQVRRPNMCPASESPASECARSDRCVQDGGSAALQQAAPTLLSGTQEPAVLEEEIGAEQSIQLQNLLLKLQELAKPGHEKRTDAVSIDVGVERYLGMAQASEPPLTGEQLILQALRLAVDDRITSRSCAQTVLVTVLTLYAFVCTNCTKCCHVAMCQPPSLTIHALMPLGASSGSSPLESTAFIELSMTQ
jgi:hypothetical protein